VEPGGICRDWSAKSKRRFADRKIPASYKPLSATFSIAGGVVVGYKRKLRRQAYIGSGEVRTFYRYLLCNLWEKFRMKIAFVLPRFFGLRFALFRVIRTLLLDCLG
jgi:hypothetical protein